MSAKKQKHLSQADRFAEIIKWTIYLEYVGVEPTAASISKKMGVAASTHLRRIIRAAVDAGFIIQIQDVHWNNRPKFVYMANFENVRRECEDWYGRVCAEMGIPVRLL